MNGTKIGKGALVVSLMLAILIPIAHISEAEILSEKPHYVSTQATFFFKDEFTAKVVVNYSWYGLWANDLERLLNQTGGEQNYTKNFLKSIKGTVKGPYIGGDMEFYPTDLKAEIHRSIYRNKSKRIDLLLTMDLEAKKGAPKESEGRKGIIYTTREDYSNITKLFVKELDLLNLTVILPKNYVVSISRPSPNAIYLANMSKELRVVVSWVLKSPTVDTRESSGYSGWFFLGIVNHTQEEVRMLEQIRRKIAEIRRSSTLSLDEEAAKKAKELFDLYYKFSTLAPRRVGSNLTYALKLANEIPIYPVSPDAVVAGVSLGIVMLEMASYLLYRRSLRRK
ncbi:MAG: hypothetical protein QI197_02415 [Candidatus Korarchaeota archaeon]|nr:hypothetical protein [Candidatus Korarchaeota archaeon]